MINHKKPRNPKQELDRYVRRIKLERPAEADEIDTIYKALLNDPEGDVADAFSRDERALRTEMSVSAGYAA